MSLVVFRCGPMLVPQDRGRRGRAHEGIARSGAFDARAAALGNRLVGNDPDGAVLEAFLGSCGFEALDPVTVAVTGAHAPVTVNGAGAATNHAVLLRRGDRLEIGMPTEGLRVYLSIRGGVDVPSVLGSRSYDSLGKIGPRPLLVGDTVRPGASQSGDVWLESVPVRPIPEVATIDIVRGPRIDWMSEASCVDLLQSLWSVDTASDRTGVRVLGPSLRRSLMHAGEELASEAMIPGAVQLPANGQPIILGPDCGTTGGYPVVAVVRQRSLSDVAQLRPGQDLRFRLR